MPKFFAALPFVNRKYPFADSGCGACGISSTHNTRAFSGGSRYKPTMSAAFGANSGSVRMDQLCRRLELNLVPPQDAPHLRLAYVTERFRQQSSIPLRVTFRRRLPEHVQYTFFGLLIVPSRVS